MRANCSSVGSAQQYQGSVRYGIVARDGQRQSRKLARSGQIPDLPEDLRARRAPLFFALDRLLNLARRGDPAPDPHCATGSTASADRTAPIELREPPEDPAAASLRESAGGSPVGSARSACASPSSRELAQKSAIALARGPRVERDERRGRAAGPRRASAPRSPENRARV